MKIRTTTQAVVMLAVAMFATLVQAGVIQSVIQFDLGSDKGTVANWNEVTSYTVGMKVTDAVNSTGATTTVDFEITDAFSGVTVNTVTNGPYSDNVIQDALYLLGDVYGEAKIHGLSTVAGVTYNFTFYATTDKISGERITKWAIGAKSVQLAAYYGNLSTVTISGVTPDENGTVVIEVDWQDNVAYWNSLVVTEVSALRSDIQFDLGSDKGTVANWNEVTSYTVGMKVTDAVNSTGATTTVDFEITDAFSGVTANTVTGGPYPDNIIQDALYLLSGDPHGEVKIHGLSTAAGMTYDFTFYATTERTSGERITKWTIGTESVQLAAYLSNFSTVTLSGVTPDENGTIVIGADWQDNAAYWNSMVVTGPIFVLRGTLIIIK